MAAMSLGFPEHVAVAEANGAGIGFLQRGDGAHEGGLAGAVGAEQAEEAVTN